MKYRKKPVVIEAVLFTRNNWRELVEFTGGVVKNFIVEKRMGALAKCEIPTLEGAMIATEGDYIIKGVQGEFYPCKPDIFNATYEVVTD